MWRVAEKVRRLQGPETAEKAQQKLFESSETDREGDAGRARRVRAGGEGQPGAGAQEEVGSGEDGGGEEGQT